jgi:cytochrome c-type biogenesis protein CcmF
MSLADRGPDGGLTVRMWNHPFVDWIWAGGLIMAFGGMVSLADRGIRVAKVERAPARGPAPAPALAPEAAVS